RRPAQARLCSARRAAPGRHHPRATDFHERDLEMSEMRDRIQGVIDNEPAALFMKGTPDLAMCGNSQRAIEALRGAGAPITPVDVLPDPQIRQELSSISGWPTIPQVFIKGELIGGADIAEELAASGELEEKLSAALGPDYRGHAVQKIEFV